MFRRKPKYPWRDGRSLAAVLADARPWLERHRIILPGGGCDPDDIVAAEARHGRPLPPDVRLLLTIVRPNPLGPHDEGGPEDFSLPALGPGWSGWTAGAKDIEPIADWGNADLLGLGGTALGDDLFWCLGHRAFPDGCIVCFSHEAGLGNGLVLAVVARSLAELITRAVMCDGFNPGDASDLSADPDDPDDDPGPIAPLDSDAAQALFDAEFAELNPTDFG